MGKKALWKNTAAVLCFFLVVNSVGPAARPVKGQVAPEEPPKERDPGLLTLEYRSRPGADLGEAFHLLLEDLKIYWAEQGKAGRRIILPEKIRRRWEEIESHYGRIRRQLEADGKRIGSARLKKRLDEFLAQLAAEMAWYRTKLGVFLDTGKGVALRREAADAIYKRIESLAPGLLPRVTGLSLRTPSVEDGRAVAKAALSAGTLETTEISFSPTQELLDLVDRLDRDPLKIYQYVRNELDYEPYPGLIKGPVRTLLEKAGNDLDLAALLVVLLRTAGYQARFAQGRIRLDIGQAMDWVGTKDPKLAAAFFVKNGLPAEIEASGGSYTGVILDHWWVQAYLPYLPRGGAGKRGADTWLNLDPSFKRYRFHYGRDAAAEIGIDPRRFLQELKSQAVIDEERSLVTGIPEEEVYNRLQVWTDGIRRYAAANGLTADRIYLGREIVREELGVLPAGLPYRVEGDPIVRENLPHDVAVSFTIRGLDRRGQIDLAYTGYLHEIAGRRLTVSYRPATADDEEIVREFGAEPGFPAYLVRLVPEIKLDGLVVASGTPLGMGERQVFEFVYTGPGTRADVTSKVLTAGSVAAVAIDLQRLPAELIHQRAGDLRLRLHELEAGRPPENDEILGEILYLWGLNYFLQADRLNAIAASALDVVAVRQPSHLLMTCDPQVEEVFGLPYRVRHLVFASWLGRDLLAPVAKTGETGKEKQFLAIAALTASALQHGLFAQTAAGTDAVSVLKIIQAANAARIPIITLNRGNYQRLIDLFPGLTEAERSLLADLTGAGYEVTVPQGEVTLGTWRGNGCLIFDPLTAASRGRFLDSDWSGLCRTALLCAGDLFYASSRQIPLAKAFTIWAGRLEEAMEAFVWSYIPAAAIINAWFANAAAVDRTSFTAAAILLSCPIADFATRPVVLNARLSVEAFSPNGDGCADVVSLTAEITRDSTWRVAVGDAAGREVRVFRGEGRFISLTWDGTDGTGTTAPEGTYTFAVSAVDKEYATEARTVMLRTVLDLTPPAAAITRPAEGGTVQGYLNVVGTVDDLCLAGYRVLLGAGADPREWRTLSQGQTPVVEGSLGLIDTYTLENGLYTLVIEAEDAAGNRAVGRSTFTVANADTAPRIRLTSPVPGAAIAGDLFFAAEVTDDRPGVEVIFFLDGAEIARLSGPPYEGTVSTHHLANGGHRLWAVAKDAAGRTTASEIVAFVTDNFLMELVASPNPFSPDGDGWEDTTRLTARLSSSGKWEIRINDAAGNVIRSFHGAGEKIDQVWDGRDETGNVVSDGDYRVEVSLPERGVTAWTTVFIRKSPAPPKVDITFPADLSRVGGRVELKGYVRSPILRRWWVEYRPVGGTSWITFLEGTAPVEGYLGVWDTTLLENGPYEVRINAEDTLGRREAIASEFTVEGELKIGNYHLELLDLSFDAGQLPAVLARSYDTTRKDVAGEFGYGWQAAVREVRLVQGADYGITITLPGGRRTTFAFTPRFPGAPYNTRIGYPEYTSLSGYPDKLSVVGLTSVIRLDDGTYLFLGAEMDEETGVAAPRYFRLETVDGLVYEIDKQTGVTKISDANGNSLTYTASAITHNSGRAIALTRDARGRIVKAVGPDGATVTYEYDAAGDLVAFTDPVGARYTYVYVNHALVRIIGPDGREIAAQEYDQSGRLTEVKDALGGTVKFLHDLGTRTATVVDRNGNATTYRYDERGNVIEKVDALGNRWAYAYDQRGNLLIEIDPLGNATRRTYDQYNNVLTEEDALGNKTTYTYAGRGLPASITDPLGRKTLFAYQGTNLTKYTDPLGNSYSFAYGSYGRMTEMTDPAGAKTVFVYEGASPNPARMIDALGNAVEYTYDAAGRVKTETRYRKLGDGTLQALVTAYEYDPAGRVTRVVYPDGREELTEYTPHGRVRAKIVDGRRTEYFYDENGRNWKILYPDGTWEEFTYDANGNRTSVRGRDGRVTQYRYDALDRLVKTIYPDGSTTEIRYDAAGRVIAEIAPNGAVTRYEYDALGRRTKVIDALGHETKYEYDAVGNQVAVIDALGTRTAYEYDAANRLVRTVFADGTAVSYEYDAAGRRVSQTDQLFLTTGYGYDALGRLISVTDALGQTTRYVYDEQGRMTEQIDANGHVTRFAYDPVGRLLEKTLPLGQKETYEYYPDGSLKAKTDPRGIRTEYIYDPVTGLLRSKVFSDGTRVDYTYWPDGRLKTATNAAGTLTYVYDAMGRLERLVDPLGNVISYTYDKAGNRTKISGPNGEIKYTYDLLGRIETVTDQQGNVTRYTYDELGRPKKVSYPNGTETIYTYDALGRLLSVVNRKTTGEVISSHRYTLDAAGHRVKIEEVGSTVEYGYDRLYRLVSEKRNGVVALDDGYTYDPVGNRLTKTSLEGVSTYTYDANDRLLSDGKYTYDWDEAGNLIGKTGPEGTTVYVYDAENRLIEANGPEGWVRFTYDAAGNRISRITSEGTTYFLVDPNMPYAQVLEETGPGGTKVYAYGNDLLNMQGPEGTRWFVYDGLGSTRALTDQAGTLTDEYTYEAFGALIHRTGVTANEFLFTGEQYEPGLGMYYLRARYYDPNVGRFWVRDPLAPLLRGSPYRYCGNNPVNDVDPSGRISLAELMTSINIQAILLRAAIGGAVGYGLGVIDALLGGADIRQALQEAIVPAGVGAVGFALSPVSIIRKILITVGLVGGAEAVAESIEQGKGKQALLRVALLIVTVWGFKNDLQNIVRNNWLSKVPDYMGEETTGILVYRAGSKTFVSGFKKMTGKLPPGTPGYDLVTMSHVEGQVAAFMRENGITEAILFINQEPCIYEVPYPDGTVSIKGCGIYLKRWLPVGTKLTIVVKGGKTMLIIGED